MEWKNITDLFCLERVHYNVYILYIFFHGVCKPCNDSYVLELHWWCEGPTRLEKTHKYHKMALCSLPVFVLNIPLFTFSYRNFFNYFFVLTYFDSLRQHMHATATQIIPAKMTSLDAIFCRGNRSSSRSLTRFCRRKHKKSTARTSRSWKNLSLTCRQVWVEACVAERLTTQTLRRSGVQALPIALFPWTRSFTPPCPSSPRCINGYRQLTAGGNPEMDKHPVQGGVAILHRLASCYGNRYKLWPCGPLARVHLYLYLPILDFNGCPQETNDSQAIWYYTMVRFRTIDLKSHPIAQFEENCIIRKKNAKFK